MKKAAIIMAGTVFYYFCTVLVLLIINYIFIDTFENLWVTAIPITFAAELLLLLYWIWKKVRQKSSSNTQS